MSRKEPSIITFREGRMLQTAPVVVANWESNQHDRWDVGQSLWRHFWCKTESADEKMA